MCDPLPPGIGTEPSHASRIVAIDTELERLSTAIKEEKRLALSLASSISKRDANVSIQLQAARLVMADACMAEMQRLAGEEDAVRQQRRDVNAAQLRGMLDELGLVQRLHVLDSMCLRIVHNFCVGNNVDLACATTLYINAHYAFHCMTLLLQVPQPAQHSSPAAAGHRLPCRSFPAKRAPCDTLCLDPSNLRNIITATVNTTASSSSSSISISSSSSSSTACRSRHL